MKYAMDHGGYRGGVPRHPLLPLHEEQRNAIREVMAKLEAHTSVPNPHAFLAPSPSKQKTVRAYSPAAWNSGSGYR